MYLYISKPARFPWISKAAEVSVMHEDSMLPGKTGPYSPVCGNSDSMAPYIQKGLELDICGFSEGRGVMKVRAWKEIEKKLIKSVLHLMSISLGY